MALYRRLLFVLTLFILVLASCTRPVLIGSDFLEDEKAFLNFSDTFDISYFTEETDSLLVHSGNRVSKQLVTYICGVVLNDPIFGKVNAEIYAQPVLSEPGTELIGATIDSVVLQLRYDTLGNYGSISELVTMEVYRMTELPDITKDYYSNQTFTTSDQLGSVTLLPRPKDSVTVYRAKDTVIVAPHIRIPLQKQFMEEIIMNDTLLENQDSFLNVFRGLHIKMTNTENTLLGFNLLNAVSGVSVYYTIDDTIHDEFKLLFSPSYLKMVNMEHDYTGSMVGASLTPEPEIDYCFVQGLSGVTTKMVINNIQDLGNVIINQAEVEFYCTFPDMDNPALYPPCPFIISQYQTDTTLDNSMDVAVALFRSTGNYHSLTYETLFGGNLEKVEDGPPVIYKYNMKVTNQIKDIYDGKKENIIYFNPIDKGNMPNRSVLIGPGDPVYHPRLKIYYTGI